MNKRGLSSIVATVLILMLTVIAVGIIAEFVFPFVKNQLSRSTECLDVQNRFYFEQMEGVNCISSSGKIILAIGAKGDKSSDKIGGIDVLLKGNSFGKVVSIRPGSSSLLIMADGSSSIELPEGGEFYTYNYSDSNVYSGAEVKTVLTSGRVCEVTSDSVKFNLC